MDFDLIVETEFPILDYMGFSTSWTVSCVNGTINWTPGWLFLPQKKAGGKIEFTAPKSIGTSCVMVSGVNDFPVYANDPTEEKMQIIKRVYPNMEATMWHSHYYSPDNLEIGDRYNHIVRFAVNGQNKNLDFSGIVIQENPDAWKLISNSVEGLPDIEVKNWIDDNRATWNGSWTIDANNYRILPDAHTLNRSVLASSHNAWLNSGEIIIRQGMRVIEPTIYPPEGEDEEKALWYLDIAFFLLPYTQMTVSAKQGIRSDGSRYYVKCPNYPTGYPSE